MLLGGALTLIGDNVWLAMLSPIVLVSYIAPASLAKILQGFRTGQPLRQRTPHLDVCEDPPLRTASAFDARVM